MNFTREETIAALGIGQLEHDLQEQVLGSFVETLEQRTGDAISGKLNDEQLKEFAEIVESKGDAAGEDWLIKTVPDYEKVEEVEYNKLVAEIKETGNTFAQG